MRSLCACKKEPGRCLPTCRACGCRGCVRGARVFSIYKGRVLLFAPGRLEGRGGITLEGWIVVGCHQQHTHFAAVTNLEKLDIAGVTQVRSACTAFRTARAARAAGAPPPRQNSSPIRWLKNPVGRRTTLPWICRYLSEPGSQFLVAQRNSKKCVRPCTTCKEI